MGFIVSVDKALKKYCDKAYIVDQDGTRTLSYREFDALSGKVARKLKTIGIGEGDAVIIRMGRCHEYIAAEYGVIRMGAIAIPVIPSYPQGRIDYIIKDSGARLVLEEDFFEDIDKYDFNPNTSGIDCFGVDKEGESDEYKRFIFYTSGSTGNPKGVILRDKAALPGAKNFLPYPILEMESMNYTTIATMSFIITIKEYYGVLLLGGRIHILSENIRKDINLIQDYYEKHEIIMGFLPPRMLKLYKNKDKKLRLLTTGSERVSNVFSDAYDIFANYGQTETIGPICQFKIDKLYDNTPIGKAFPGLEIKIVDEDGNEVANGEEGTITVIGDLPYEYNNLPEASAKTFCKLDNGKVIVYTGDRGKILPDGNLLFVNRNDWMIKIHGMRVEPGEIESVMNKVKGITGSVVKAFENEDGSMLLCGFYTESKTVNKQEIQKALKDYLPDYMIPSAFVRLDAFPVNDNGKINRKAIEKPDLSQGREIYEAPTNELEEKICKAMESILDIDKIGRNDDFYSLGGNSINAVALAAACNIPNMQVMHVLIGKTPKGIVEQYQKNSNSIKPKLSKKYKAQKEYSLTLGNKYNLYDCSTIGAPIDFMDLRAFYELDDSVDLEKLKKAIEDTIKAHPVFGIHIDHTAGIFYRNDDYEVNIGDIRVEPEQFEEYRHDKARKKRDFMKDPIYDISIVHVGEEAVFLYINMTHQLFDGTTLQLFYDEISDRYQGKMPPKESFDYFDLAKHEDELKNSSIYEEAFTFFEKQYAGIKKINVDDSEGHPHSHAVRTTNIDFAKIGKEAFLKENGISQIIYIQAALALAIGKELDLTKFSYKVIHSGREESAYTGIFGSIARALYMTVDIDEDLSVKDYLNALQERYQETLYYDVVPIQEIVEKYPNIESSIFLNYTGNMGMEFRLGEKRFKFSYIGYFFDEKYGQPFLNFQMAELPDDNLNIMMTAGYLPIETSERILDNFEKTLDLLVKSDKISDIKKELL